jgi:hypothetical protein
MSFYHNLITQKSWEELKNLKRTLDFVLIGGWAIYLYTKALKSKDIDILIEYEELGKLKKLYSVAKNERLKKYEAVKEEIQIDIYLPYYSLIGIPVEDLIKETTSLESFTVLKKEWLFTTKLYALSKRARSGKGEKDLLDLISLYINGFDRKKVLKIINKYKLEDCLDSFVGILNERTEAQGLNLNRHNYKKLKVNILKDFRL